MMQTPCYYLEIPKKRFQRVADAIQARIAGSGGVLLPVSSRRAILSAGIIKELITSLGQDQIKTWLRKQGVVDIEKISSDRAMELIRTRESADLPSAEIADCDPALAVNGFDWHLEEIKVPKAWGLFPDFTNIDWGDLRIGHLDTGFTDHPAISSSVNKNLDKNFYSVDFETDTITELTMAGISADRDSAKDPLGGPSAGHGTKTMSLLAGFDESKRSRGEDGCYKGYYGIAPKVPVVPIRLTDSVLISHLMRNELPEALIYLVEDAKCKVISMSLGAPILGLPGEMPKKLSRAVDLAYERGVIFVSAAGNNIPNERVIWPARLPKIIAVAGSTHNKTTWRGSSRGTPVDISAPAFPIRRAKTKRRGSKRHTYPAGGKGTSYATPQVAGTAALWLAHHGVEIESTYPIGWQRIEAFRKLLKQTAQTITGTNADLYGAGVLDAHALMTSPLPKAESLTKTVG